MKGVIPITLYEKLTELMEKIGYLRNEVKWAERNPDDTNPDIGDRAIWKTRVNDARAKVDTMKTELKGLLAQIAAEISVEK